MLGLVFVYWLLQLFAPPLTHAKGLIEVANFADLGKDYNCPGGNVYFVAHAVDALLYMNPDLYHDLHTFKCTTLVVFTAGDRGQKNSSFTESLEKGLEASWSFMAGAPVNESKWDGVKIARGEQLVSLRYLEDWKGISIIYLRFPDGASDGEGYKETGSMSLKRLYQNRIQKMTSVDKETTYSLQGLKDLIATILEWKRPSIIRTLDAVTPIPNDGNNNAEHADHSVSARLVHEVVKDYNVSGTVTSYGGNLMRKFGTTMEKDSEDFLVKSKAYFEYAKFDKDMCKAHFECMKQLRSQAADIPDDVEYTVKYLNREYYAM